MSTFAFEATQPRHQGRSTTMDLGWGDLLSTVYRQGLADPWTAVALGWQKSYNRAVIDDLSELLSPEEANELYGIPDGPKPLKFDEPVRRWTAEDMHNDRREELRRIHTLSSATHPAFSLKTVGSFGATIVASMSHPVDLLFAFFPVVGEARAAKALYNAGKAGRLGWRAKMARGLITQEQLSGILAKYPRLTSSIIDASVGESIIQIPNFIRENENEGFGRAVKEYGQNIAFAGVSGAAFRAATESLISSLGIAGRMWMRFGPEVKDAVGTKSFNDLMRGDPIQIKDVTDVSDEVILESVKFDEDAAMARARREVEAEEDDIISLSKARLEREGTFGKINEGNLIATVRRIVDGTIPGGKESPQGMILRDLLKKYDSISEVVGVRLNEKPIIQRRALAKSMANTLSMELDEAAKGIPAYYIGDAQIFSPAKGFDYTPEMAAKEAEQIYLQEFLNREIHRLRRILNQRVQRDAGPGRVQSAQKKIEELEEKLRTLQRGFEDPKTLRYVDPMSHDERSAVASMMWRSQRERLEQKVAEEKTHRIKKIFERLKAEAIEAGRPKAQMEAIRQKQKLGQVMGRDLLKEKVLTDRASKENVDLIETDVETLAQGMGLDEAATRRLINGERDIKAEQELNAKLDEQGRQMIDFDDLYRAMADEGYISRADEIRSAHDCLRRTHA